MKVRATVTVEVSLAKWADTAHCWGGEVRQDVLDYIRATLQSSAMVEDTEATVTVK